MKNVTEKMLYLSDGEIYGLWKYLNGFGLVKRGGILNFDDLTASGESRLSIARFLSLLKDLGVDIIKGLVFHKETYLKYHKKGFEELKKKKESGELNAFSIKHLEFLEKITTNPNALYENSAGFFDFVLYEGNLGCLEFFEFSADLFSKDRKKIDSFITEYIKKFINNNLQKDRVNFYQFSEQRKELFSELYSCERKYGKVFIFKYPENYFLTPNTEYLFIHTLIALEKLGYLEVEEIWIFDMDLSPEEQTENYKVKVNLKDKFFNEKDEIVYGIDKLEDDKLFIKPTKKIEDQKKGLDFDDKKGTLFFNNKEIVISKTRNSNGHYLLKTIFKNKNKTWEFDEIAEDWAYEYKKGDWSKYYNAGYKVNEKVAKETTIKDFLSITSKTVGINKKYM